jgi:two-component system sensor histidine kinase ChiS
MPTKLAPSQLSSILFVDDDVEDLKLWADSLRELRKYRVLTAMSASEGVERCKANHIDCVVLDLDLDRESGFELLLELWQNSERPRVPVGILTKLSSPTLRDMALHNGASFWLAKARTSAADLDRAIHQAITASSK